MKRMYLLFGIGLLVFLLCSGCEEGPLYEMDRLAEDPFIASPRSECFLMERCVELSWEEDPAADEYILRRAQDAAQPNYQILYRGGKTSFQDVDLQHEQRYLYTLSKRKGKREFGPSEPSLGVGHDSIGDMWEPNDGKGEAAGLLFQLNANAYFYQDYHDNCLTDVDWYTLSIPPRHVAWVQIDQIRPEVGGENTYLFFQQEGHSRIEFADNDPIEIYNYSMEERSFRFRVSPIPAKCIHELEVAGGTLIEYTVTLATIQLL